MQPKMRGVWKALCCISLPLVVVCTRSHGFLFLVLCDRDQHIYTVLLFLKKKHVLPHAKKKMCKLKKKKTPKKKNVTAPLLYVAANKKKATCKERKWQHKIKSNDVITHLIRIEQRVTICNYTVL